MTDDGNKGLRLTPPELDWLPEDTPVSREFGDVYFSRHGGLAESRFVFLEQNRLPERWRALPNQKDTLFCVAETGFGTGLNFLLCWLAWRANAAAAARLLYISIENYPLAVNDLLRALNSWPELDEPAQVLAQALPPPLVGQHLLQFDHGRVSLLLCYGPVERALDDLLCSTSIEFDRGAEAKVDAWFLDGFAPRSNPSMWSDTVLRNIAALSRPGTTLSSFTVAGQVRRGLTAVGYKVEKAPGYGSKRELLRGEFAPSRRGTQVSVECTETPWHRPSPRSNVIRHAIVIGAGIAGACTARALAERGWQVQVLESNDDVAGGASGNPQAIIHTRLPLQASAHGDFSLASYDFALRYYRNLASHSPMAAGAVHLDGLLQLYDDSGTDGRLSRLASIYRDMDNWVSRVNAAQASQLTGQRLNSPGLWMAQAGWVEPTPLCRALLKHSGISVNFSNDVTELKAAQDGWSLRVNDNRTLDAQSVILANSHGATRLVDIDYLRVGSIRGQISRIPSDTMLSPLRHVICAEAYVAPAIAGYFTAGASYRLDDQSLELSDQEHQQNLAAMQAMLPEFGRPSLGTLHGRVGFRCTSRDYLPIVGEVPDQGEFRNRFTALGQNARRAIPSPGPMLHGLYLNIAHGSRGFSHAPLCAELLAAQLSGEIPPVSRRLQRALHPARFLAREIIRGEVT